MGARLTCFNILLRFEGFARKSSLQAIFCELYTTRSISGSVTCSSPVTTVTSVMQHFVFISILIFHVLYFPYCMRCIHFMICLQLTKKLCMHANKRSAADVFSMANNISG